MRFSPELAEFVGIMLGDGHISYPSTQRFKITLDSLADEEYSYYVYSLLDSLFGTKVIMKKRKNESTLDIFIFNRKILHYIIYELGLLPSPKWNRAEVPDWVFENKFEKEVLRGYFDTDGCVVITNNNGKLYPRLEMKISPSPMQNQLISMLRSLGFKFGVYEIGKGEKRIQINGVAGLEQWVSLIGFSNPKHRHKAGFFLIRT